MVQKEVKTVQIAESLHNKLKKLATEQRTTVKDLLEKILIKQLNK